VKTFALLGHPLGHSVSPALHHAAYEQFGLDHRYVTIDCPDEDAVKAQREALVRRELAGLNITVPWKRLALRLADRVDPSAARTGAANVWVRTEEGQVVAHNTDAGALRDCLRAARIPRDAENLETLVLGNGGAARASPSCCATTFFSVPPTFPMSRARNFARTSRNSWPAKICRWRPSER
jgi:shikimate dehydrogenase